MDIVVTGRNVEVPEHYRTKVAEKLARIERYAADRPLPCKVRTWTLLVGALESAGVAFIEENGGGPGVRLRKRRAS